MWWLSLLLVFGSVARNIAERVTASLIAAKVLRITGEWRSQADVISREKLAAEEAEDIELQQAFVCKFREELNDVIGEHSREVMRPSNLPSRSGCFLDV